jgi:hypothetical protein
VVGGNPATLGTGDVAVRSRLQTLGYTVSVVGDSASVAADATGKQVVVISSSSISGNVNTKFRASTVPVVTWEPGLFDDLGMTATGTSEVAGQTSLVIVAPGHPLAAGLSGTVTVVATAGAFAVGSPNANATVVATLSGATTASIFAYELGAAMPGLAAPARRVGLFMSDATAASFTASGTALFNAAITWAAATTSLSASTTLAAMVIAGPDEGHWSASPASGDDPDVPVPRHSGSLPATIPDGVKIKGPRIPWKPRSFRYHRSRRTPGGRPS